MKEKTTPITKEPDLLALTISRLADIDEKEQRDLDQHTPICNVMNTDIITAGPDLDLSYAISLLLDNKYGCLPVVVAEKLVGIVTEADFLQLTLDLLQETQGSSIQAEKMVNS